MSPLKESSVFGRQVKSSQLGGEISMFKVMPTVSISQRGNLGLIISGVLVKPPLVPLTVIGTYTRSNLDQVREQNPEPNGGRLESILAPYQYFQRCDR